WQTVVVRRGAVLWRCSWGDALYRNPNPPPWMGPDDPGLASFVAHLSNFDGRWYIGLAEHGYRRLPMPDFEGGGRWMVASSGLSWRWAATDAPQWKFYGPLPFLSAIPGGPPGGDVDRRARGVRGGGSVDGAVRGLRGAAVRAGAASRGGGRC